MIRGLLFFLSLHSSCSQIRFPEEPASKGKSSSLTAHRATVELPRLKKLLQSIEDEKVEKDQVYTMTDTGFIECAFDSECPPTTPPVWDELNKMEDHVVTSITELSTEVSFCSKSRFFGHVCDIRREPFCEYELGRDHPECQRCNGQSPPQPPCFRYALKSYVDIDQCCSDVFNVTNLEEQETHLKHEDQPSDSKVMPKNISTSNQSPLTILAGKL